MALLYFEVDMGGERKTVPWTNHNGTELQVEACLKCGVGQMVDDSRVAGTMCQKCGEIEPYGEVNKSISLKSREEI